MKLYSVFSAVFIVIIALPLFVVPITYAGSGEGVHWGYKGDSGPKNWHKLDPKYVMCKAGKNQSPIDVANSIGAELEPIQFTYEKPATEILNNGHAIQVNVSGGNTITLAGREFELKQFHFHAPSENLIDGKPFAMEVHLVHVDKDGNAAAVIGVMFDKGNKNQVIETLWKQMPQKTGERQEISTEVHPMDILPEEKDYYRFNGSLTTPPCSEGLWWLVMKDILTVSNQQVEAFDHVIGANNRPVQAINARPILQ